MERRLPVAVSTHGARTMTGNLAWAMQLYYQVYLYTLDPTVLQTMYPLLRRSVNFYIHYQILNSSDNT